MINKALSQPKRQNALFMTSFRFKFAVSSIEKIIINLMNS